MKITFEKGLRLMILLILLILAGIVYVLSRDRGPNFNKYQVIATMQKLSCYQDLVDKVQRSEEAQDYLLMLRGLKEKGNSDLIERLQENRLIDTTELRQFLDVYLDTNCRTQLRKDRDFRGLRFIDKNLVILEVDRFNRRLEGRLSRYTTLESHRLIFSDSKPNLKDYSVGQEREVIYKKVADDCYYQITQLKTLDRGNMY